MGTADRPFPPDRRTSRRARRSGKSSPAVKYVPVCRQHTVQKKTQRCEIKCIHREDGQKLLAEIHGGICGHHIGARALAGKAFWQGFFWPTALQDATAQVTKCEPCQFVRTPILSHTDPACNTSYHFA